MSSVEVAPAPAFEAAVERTTSPSFSCPHARCAGCTLLDVPLDEQLVRKRTRSIAALSLYPALTAAPSPASPGMNVHPVAAATPMLGYRTRTKWMAGPGATLGLYARDADHQVVDIPSCRVAPEALLSVGASLRLLMKSGPAFVRSVADGGALFAVDLRAVESEGEPPAVMVTLIVDEKRAPAETEARAFAASWAAACPVPLVSIALNFHMAGAPQLLGARTLVVHGEGFAWDTPGLARVRALHGSFVQAHRGQAARIQERLRAVLASLPGPRSGPRRVLDLYGGSGAIALALASSSTSAPVTVDLVESFAPAARAAEEAARAAGVTVRALPGDAATLATRLSTEGGRYDLVVVNPPRRGVVPEVRRAVAAMKPQRIAYVSCDPATLARDLDHLRRLGYATSELWPLDMIPLTDELETVAILAPSAIPPAEVLHEEPDAVFVWKAPHEPTTPQGEHAFSLFDRVRLLPGFEGAVPVHRLDAGTSGVCLFARTASTVHPWSRALTGGEKTYTALLRGVTSSRGVVTRPLRDEGRMLTASTRYRRLAVVGGHSLVEARPREGRTHQIRRHLAGLGHPVLGDDRYGHEPSNRFFAAKFGLDRAFLHCSRMVLTHPVTGQPLTVEAPLAGDLAAVRAALEGGRSPFAIAPE